MVRKGDQIRASLRQNFTGCLPAEAEDEKGRANDGGHGVSQQGGGPAGTEVETEPEGSGQGQQLACDEVHLRGGQRRFMRLGTHTSKEPGGGRKFWHRFGGWSEAQSDSNPLTVVNELECGRRHKNHNLNGQAALWGPSTGESPQDLHPWGGVYLVQRESQGPAERQQQQGSGGVERCAGGLSHPASVLRGRRSWFRWVEKLTLTLNLNVKNPTSSQTSLIWQLEHSDSLLLNFFSFSQVRRRKPLPLPVCAFKIKYGQQHKHVDYQGQGFIYAHYRYHYKIESETNVNHPVFSSKHFLQLCFFHFISKLLWNSVSP